MDIESVVAKHEDALMAVAGVIGVGIGEHDHKLVIVVMVVAITPEISRLIPKSIGGFDVVLEVSGTVDIFTEK